jgi:hypothetical protein
MVWQIVPLTPEQSQYPSEAGASARAAHNAALKALDSHALTAH